MNHAEVSSVDAQLEIMLASSRLPTERCAVALAKALLTHNCNVGVAGRDSDRQRNRGTQPPKSCKSAASHCGLVAGAQASWATEPTLHVPDTALARQQIDLLRRTQAALTNFYAARAPHDTVNIANAWYYPTAQANTVFVQLATGNLFVVEMAGNRIAQLRDLTSAATETAVATTHLEARNRTRS